MSYYNRYDHQRLARLVNLNDDELKQLLIALNQHEAHKAWELLGYTVPNPYYRWIDWTYYKLPLIYQIYNNDLEIRNDFELKLLVKAIRNFEQEVNN